jgi:HK97 family phage major capsid protein
MESKDPKDLRAARADEIEAAAVLIDAAEAEDRDFSEDEQSAYDAHIAKAAELEKRAVRLETVGGISASLAKRQAPVMLQQPLGDSEYRRIANFIRTGDKSGLEEDDPGAFTARGVEAVEVRASNDTTMNITTAADGGNAVPTGHFQGIVARRDESMLAQKLGVMNIPGKGTTVNVPVDNEADGEFVSTAESAAYDRDAPALDQKAMTLVKYTKKVDLTVELLEDEDSRLMSFLDDFVGRGMAKTHNDLLLIEVAANGTSLKTFASATAIAAGEPEDIVFQNDLSEYLDDAGSVAWVMRAPTFGDIASITGSDRLYAETPGGSFMKEILGYPVEYSAKAAAAAASAKSVYFGNWNFVGKREAPSFSLIRDPYSRAGNGELILHYMFRTVYAVLIAEAIGYGEHPSS